MDPPAGQAAADCAPLVRAMQAGARGLAASGRLSWVLESIEAQQVEEPGQEPGQEKTPAGALVCSVRDLVGHLRGAHDLEVVGVGVQVYASASAIALRAADGLSTA